VMRFDDNDFATDDAQRTPGVRPVNGDDDVHRVGWFVYPLIAGKGLTVTELAQALSVQENGVEALLNGEVMPTGAQLAGLSDLLDVPLDDLKDLLPERQRQLIDHEDKMEDFKLTINGVTFTLKGDTAAQQAVTKALTDNAVKLDEATATIASLKVDGEKAVAVAEAKADAADAARAKAEAERDSAVDPTAIRKRIDERLALERTAESVLGDKFDATKDDDALRSEVIVAVQPEAKLDGKSDAYVAARFDAAVELFASAKKDTKPGHVPARVAARHVVDNDNTDADPVEVARAAAKARNDKLWQSPLAASKDAKPETVTIRH